MNSILRPLTLLALAATLGAQTPRVLDPRLHPAPQAILSTWLQSIAARQLAGRRSAVEAITTKAAYEERKTRLRASALQMIGAFPATRPPLNLRVTGVLKRTGYRVDKVIYESLPRYYVTGNLYIPDGPGPFAAVLQPVGHSTTAKNRAFYQRIAIALVRQGMAVLTYDPIGQGERRLYWDTALGDSKAGGTTHEHSMLGWQAMLGGLSAAHYRIWDGLRSLDVLASHPLVDKSRLGVTGCSGGGTLTTYIAALDDRVKVAAPACYITSWEDQLQGTGPQDAEQQFPDQLREGLNHSDWIGLAAPKPYLIVSTDQDFFPIEGARKTFAEMKRVYGLYDAAVKIDWFHEPGGHGVPTASRQAIAAWMKRWLKGDPSPVNEPPIETEHEEDLNATATGQVATSLGGETAVTVNIARLSALRPSRANIVENATRLTRYERATSALKITKGPPVTWEGIRVDPFTFAPAEGLIAAAAVLKPGVPGTRVALYLDPRSKFTPDARDLVRLGYTVLALDVSGTGETAFSRHAGAPWSAPQLAFLALMTGRTMIGIRMNDIARGLDALAELGLLPDAGVTAFAKGRLGPVLLHAAAVDRRITRVVAEDSLVSYAAVARNPLHRDIEDLVIPGVAAQYDLPGLTAAIAPRPIVLANLRSQTGHLLLRAEATAAYPKMPHIRVGLRREEESIESAYPEVK